MSYDYGSLRRSSFARLAINGGSPVRASFLPYGRQSVDEADVQAVVDVLRSDWLTTGPKVARVRRGLCCPRRCGACREL